MIGNIQVLKRKVGFVPTLVVGAVLFSALAPFSTFAQQLPVLQPNLSAGAGSALNQGVGVNSGIRDYYGAQGTTAPPAIATQQAASNSALTIYQPYAVPYGDASLSLAAQQAAVQPAMQTQFVQQPAVQYQFVQQPMPQTQFVQQPMVQQQIPMPQFAQQPAPQPQFVQQPTPQPQFVQQPTPQPQFAQQPAPQPQFVQQPAPQPQMVQRPVAQQAAPQRQAMMQPAHHHSASAGSGAGDIVNNNYNTIDVRVPRQQAAARTVYVPQASAPLPVSQPISSPRRGCGIVKATDKLNLRRGPGVGYSKVCTVPAGYRMACGGCKGKWCKVKFRGRYYWASKNFLTSTR